MKVEVQLKREFGRERFYPLSDDAKIMCEIFNATTLTKGQLKKLRDRGHEVAVQIEQYSLED